MIIEEKLTKIKRFLGGNTAIDLFIIFVVASVGFAGFGLGRISVTVNTSQDIYTEQAAAAVSGKSDGVVQEGSYVASRNGTKYHFPWCSGAQRMKEENKIWFASVGEAQKAGYAPAANGKGLK